MGLLSSAFEDVWLKRCEARLIALGVSLSEVKIIARKCWNSDDPDDGRFPEDVADSFISGWGSSN